MDKHTHVRGHWSGHVCCGGCHSPCPRDQVGNRGGGGSGLGGVGEEVPGDGVVESVHHHVGAGQQGGGAAWSEKRGYSERVWGGGSEEWIPHRVLRERMEGGRVSRTPPPLLTKRTVGRIKRKSKGGKANWACTKANFPTRKKKTINHTANSESATGGQRLQGPAGRVQKGTGQLTMGAFLEGIWEGYEGGASGDPAVSCGSLQRPTFPK